LADKQAEAAADREVALNSNKIAGLAQDIAAGNTPPTMMYQVLASFGLSPLAQEKAADRVKWLLGIKTPKADDSVFEVK
jgi:hypothetical protein